MSGVAELLSASLKVLLFMKLDPVSKWRSRGLSSDVPLDCAICSENMTRQRSRAGELGTRITKIVH
jgi:hypothetical protein